MADVKLEFIIQAKGVAASTGEYTQGTVKEILSGKASTASNFNGDTEIADSIKNQYVLEPTHVMPAVYNLLDLAFYKILTETSDAKFVNFRKVVFADPDQPQWNGNFEGKQGQINDMFPIVEPSPPATYLTVPQEYYQKDSKSAAQYSTAAKAAGGWNQGDPEPWAFYFFYPFTGPALEDYSNTGGEFGAYDAIHNIGGYVQEYNTDLNDSGVFRAAAFRTNTEWGDTKVLGSQSEAATFCEFDIELDPVNGVNLTTGELTYNGSFVISAQKFRDFLIKKGFPLMPDAPLSSAVAGPPNDATSPFNTRRQPVFRGDATHYVDFAVDPDTEFGKKFYKNDLARLHPRWHPMRYTDPSAKAANAAMMDTLRHLWDLPLMMTQYLTDISKNKEAQQKTQTLFGQKVDSTLQEKLVEVGAAAAGAALPAVGPGATPAAIAAASSLSMWLGMPGEINYGSPSIGRGLPQGTRVKVLYSVGYTGKSGHWVPIEICADDPWFAEGAGASGKTNKEAYEEWTRPNFHGQYPKNFNLGNSKKDKWVATRIYVKSSWLTRFVDVEKDPLISPATLDQPPPPAKILESYTISTDLFKNNEWTKLDSCQPKYVWNKDEGQWQYWIKVSTQRKTNPEDDSLDQATPTDNNPSNDGKDNSEDGGAPNNETSKANIESARKSEKNARIEQGKEIAAKSLMAYYDTDAVFSSINADGHAEITVADPAGLASAVKAIKHIGSFMNTVKGDPEPNKLLYALPASFFHAVSRKDYTKRYINILNDVCKEDCFVTGFNSSDSYKHHPGLPDPKNTGIKNKLEQVAKILESYHEDIQEFKEEGGSVIFFDAKQEAKDLRGFVPTLEGLMKEQSANGFVKEESGTEAESLNRLGIVRAPLYLKLQNGMPKVEAQEVQYFPEKNHHFIMHATNNMRPVSIQWLPADIRTKGAQVKQHNYSQTLPLRVGFDCWTKKEPITNTRTIGYVFYADEMILEWNKSKEKPAWIDFVTKWSYPPPAITSAKNLSSEFKDCAKMLQETKEFRVKTEDDIERENAFFSNVPCMQRILAEREASRQFIADDFMRPDELLRRAERIDTFWRLYTEFFSRIDATGLVAMLMSCLSKQLGLELTAEALCEAAFTKMVQEFGLYNSVDKLVQIAPELAPVMGQILETAGIPPDPKKQGFAQDNNLDPDQIADPAVRQAMADKYNSSPLAFALLLGMAKVENGNISAAQSQIINFISLMESGGKIVELVPVPVGANVRVFTSHVNNLANALGLDPISEEFQNNVGDFVMFDPQNVQAGRERADIRRRQLEEEGYDIIQQDKIMLEEGILAVKVTEVPATTDIFFNAAEELLNASPVLPYSQSLDANGNATFIGTDGVAQNLTKIKDFITAVKQYVNLQRICEELVQLVLDTPNLLFAGPSGFSGIGDRFKNIFTMPKLPKFNFPRRLKTQDLFDGYEEKLIGMIKSMIYDTLREVLKALVEDLVARCLEESTDNHTAGNPPEDLGKIDFGAQNFTPNNIPLSFDDPSVNSATLNDWLSDILSMLTINELCFLLNGEASSKVIQKILAHTEYSFPNIFKSLNTASKIRYYFIELGKTTDLDICSAIPQYEEVFDTLCDATFNNEIRCSILQSHGLTEEECQEQIEKELASLKDKLKDLALLDDAMNIPEIEMCKSGRFQLPESVRHSTESAFEALFSSVNISFNQDLDVLRDKYLPLAATAEQLMKNMGDGQSPGAASEQFQTKKIKSYGLMSGMPFDKDSPNYIKDENNEPKELNYKVLNECKIAWNFWDLLGDSKQKDIYPDGKPTYLADGANTILDRLVVEPPLHFPHLGKIIPLNHTLGQYFEGFKFGTTAYTGPGNKPTDPFEGKNIFTELIKFGKEKGHLYPWAKVISDADTKGYNSINPFMEKNWHLTFGEAFNINEAYSGTHDTLLFGPKWLDFDPELTLHGIVFHGVYPGDAGLISFEPDDGSRMDRPKYFSAEARVAKNTSWGAAGADSAADRNKQIGNLPLYERLQENFKFFAGTEVAQLMSSENYDKMEFPLAFDSKHEKYLGKIKHAMEWSVPNTFSSMNESERAAFKKEFENITKIGSGQMLGQTLAGDPDASQFLESLTVEAAMQEPKIKVSHSLVEKNLPIGFGEDPDIVVDPDKDPDFEFLGHYKYEVIPASGEPQLVIRGFDSIPANIKNLLEGLQITPGQIETFYNKFTSASQTGQIDEHLLANKKAALFASFMKSKLSNHMSEINSTNPNAPEASDFKNIEFFLARYCWYALKAKSLGKVFRETSNSKYLRKGPIRAFFSKFNPSPMGAATCDDISSIPGNFADLKNKFYDPDSLVEDAIIRYERLLCQEMFEEKIFEEDEKPLQIAALEMLIKSMIRIYVCEVMVTAMPTLGKFKAIDLVNSYFTKYVIDNMKRDIGKFDEVTWEEVTKRANTLVMDDEKKTGINILSRESAVSYMIKKEVNNLFARAEFEGIYTGARSISERTFANNSINLVPHVVNISSPIYNLDSVAEYLRLATFDETDLSLKKSIMQRLTEDFGGKDLFYSAAGHGIVDQYINSSHPDANANEPWEFPDNAGASTFNNRIRMVTQPTFNQFFKTTPPGQDNPTAQTIRDCYKINTKMSLNSALKISQRLFSMGAWDKNVSRVPSSQHEGLDESTLLQQDFDLEGGFIIEPYLYVDDKHDGQGSVKWNPQIGGDAEVTNYEDIYSDPEGVGKLRSYYNMFGYVNPDAWAHALSTNFADFVDTPVENDEPAQDITLQGRFNSWRVGLRLSYVLPLKPGIDALQDKQAASDNYSNENISYSYGFPQYVKDAYYGTEEKPGVIRLIENNTNESDRLRTKTLLQKEISDNPTTDGSLLKILSNIELQIANPPANDSQGYVDYVFQSNLYSLYEDSGAQSSPVVTIPLTEVSKEIVFAANSISYPDETSSFAEDFVGNFGDPFLQKVNAIHQDLASDLQETPEYKLLFDHLFDPREDIFSSMLTTIYGNANSITSPNIEQVANLETFFSRTKDTILSAYRDMKNANNYQYKSTDLQYTNENAQICEMTNTKGVDMDELLANIALRTPLLILKGFAETTDPAIMTANGIINAAYYAATAGVNVAKAVQLQAKAAAQAVFDTAKQVQAEAEQNLAVLEPPVESALLQANLSIKVSDFGGLTIKNNGKPDYSSLGPDMLDEINALSEGSPSKKDSLDQAVKAYVLQKKVLDETKVQTQIAEDELTKINEEVETKLKEIQQTIDDVKASPFTLPATVMALVPGAVPGAPWQIGFPPPPMGIGVGPPLTWPGLAYLLTNFFDDFELARADELSPAECEVAEDTPEIGYSEDDEI